MAAPLAQIAQELLLLPGLDAVALFDAKIKIPEQSARQETR
jgi:hypothetical protein